ncbi:T9SS type A sorting domain-containing protein [bacterium]|nr:T9SS type A sorting domain-containing protein [bacterium]MBU1984603.1 T9SS type A sorting domain-containing protein [bacterium]
MKRRMPLCALMIVLAMAVSLFATPANIQLPEVRRATITDPSHSPRYLDETIFYEDWEEGNLADWTPIDLTAEPSWWHLDTRDAFGGSGTSWWMGNPAVGANGGYLDDWYMVLDSPPIQLPAGTPMLRFMSRYSCEDPAGAEAPYNGWDGLNIRISVNSGPWTVIPNTAVNPAYDRTSLYSFGFQHGEGANIPGWCGVNTSGHRNWYLQTANLSQWAGQNVKIRWAFASDPAYNTTNNSQMFGWMIDNIRVYAGTDTTFSDNADAVGDWTTSSVRPTGGNLWRIATDATSPAGPNIVVCNNVGTNLYNTDMNNVLESPIIDVSALPFGTLIADVQVTGVVMCETGFPDCDYWGMEVSMDSGMTWCAVSNPTCEPGVPNYVYSDCPTFWSSFNESYSTPMDFSDFIGHTVKFRFTLQTNDDALLAVGPKFDGFSLEYTGGFPNDVTCYTLQVRYPNMAGRAFKIKGYFRNVGSLGQNEVQGFWRILGSSNRPFLPRFSLEPGQIATRDTVAIIATAGATHTMQAWSALNSDDNVQNDTSTVTPIVVAPSGPDLEFGYDNRTTQFRFNYVTGRGPLVHFTPCSDGTLPGGYSVSSILAMFDAGQPADLPIRYHVYLGGTTAPGTEVYNELITVLRSETGAWKATSLAAVPELQNIQQDFWVWLETVATGEERYPQILGDDKQLWDDVHFYTWGGTGAPTVSDFFYQIHARVRETTDVEEEVVLGVPTVWSLAQNYPNPFNPSTEILYSVPRAEPMTLKVYNLIGQEVATLFSGVTQPGVHRISFNGANLASGVYLYRLEAESFSAARKMLLMK